MQVCPRRRKTTLLSSGWKDCGSHHTILVLHLAVRINGWLSRGTHKLRLHARAYEIEAVTLQISAFFGNPIHTTAFECSGGARRAMKLPLSTSLTIVNYYCRQISLFCHPRRFAATRSTRSIRCPKACGMPRSCDLVGKVRCDFEGRTVLTTGGCAPISSGQVGVINSEGRVPLAQRHKKHRGIESPVNALFC